jgi:adenylylsulfate kinase
LFNEAGLIVITAFISPYRDDRDAAKRIIGQQRFLEVFLDAPLEVCEARDPKGLYRKARAGEVSGFTGISAPYEEPKNPALVVPTGTRGLEECTEAVLSLLESKGIIMKHPD